jgi:hypothetical protein
MTAINYLYWEEYLPGHIVAHTWYKQLRSMPLFIFTSNQEL